MVCFEEGSLIVHFSGSTPLIGPGEPIGWPSAIFSGGHHGWHLGRCGLGDGNSVRKRIQAPPHSRRVAKILTHHFLMHFSAISLYGAPRGKAYICVERRIYTYVRYAYTMHNFVCPKSSENQFWGDSKPFHGKSCCLRGTSSTLYCHSLWRKTMKGPEL